MGIDPELRDEELRAEALDDLRDHLIESPEIEFVAGTGRKRDVEAVSFSAARTHLVDPAGPGKEGSPVLVEETVSTSGLS
jgi:hypothetical protein